MYACSVPTVCLVFVLLHIGIYTGDRGYKEVKINGRASPQKFKFAKIVISWQSIFIGLKYE